MLISHQRQLSLSVSQVSRSGVQEISRRYSGDIQESTCHVPGSGEADQEQDSVHHSGAGHHLHQSPGIVTSIDSDLELDMSLSAGSDRDSTEAHRA